MQGNKDEIREFNEGITGLCADREVCDRHAVLLAKRVLETNSKHARESLTASFCESA